MRRKHISLMRLFVAHFSGSQDLLLDPHWETIIRQLAVTSAAAAILQHNAWTQLALLLNFDSCEPFGRETMLTEAH